MPIRLNICLLTSDVFLGLGALSEVPKQENENKQINH